MDKKETERMRANILVEEAREIFSRIWELGLPEEERLDRLRELSAVLHVHYLEGK